MIKKSRSYILLLIFTSVLGCKYSTFDDNSLLKNYDLNGVDNTIIYLPDVLKEVSGIAHLDENFLLTHNDEEGIVYKINFTSGEIVSEFSIGKEEIEKDFEGIAVVHDSVYLVASNGTLFKFSLFNGKNDIEYEKIYVHPNNHAGYYPGAVPITLKLIFETPNGRILGAQAV